jgi:hypothetical protein
MSTLPSPGVELKSEETREKEKKIIKELSILCTKGKST